MSTLNFFGAVNLGVRKVQEAGYADAELYEVDATSEPYQQGGVSHVRDLNQLRCVFNTDKDDKQGTVMTKSVGGWSEFGPVSYIPEPWVECVVIPWPPADDVMLPEKALALMRSKGYTGKFLSMTFRWPLYPGVDEVKYMFTMADGTYVIVGAISGNIETETKRNAKAGNATY